MSMEECTVVFMSSLKLPHQVGAKWWPKTDLPEYGRFSSYRRKEVGFQAHTLFLRYFEVGHVAQTLFV